LRKDKAEETKSCGCNVNVPYKQALDSSQIYKCLRCGKYQDGFCDKEFKDDLENKKYIVIGQNIPWKCWEQIHKIANERLHFILNKIINDELNIKELINDKVRIF